MRSVRPAPLVPEDGGRSASSAAAAKDAGNVIAQPKPSKRSKAKGHEDKREIAGVGAVANSGSGSAPACCPIRSIRPNRWSSNHNWHSNRSTTARIQTQGFRRARNPAALSRERSPPVLQVLHSITGSRDKAFRSNPRRDGYLLSLPTQSGFTIRRKSLAGAYGDYSDSGRDKELVMHVFGGAQLENRTDLLDEVTTTRDTGPARWKRTSLR